MSKNYVEAYKELGKLYLEERDEYKKLVTEELELLRGLDQNSLPIDFKNISDYSERFESAISSREQLMAFYRKKSTKRLNTLPEKLASAEKTINESADCILEHSTFGLKELATVLSNLIMEYEGRSYSLKKIKNVDFGSGELYGLVSDPTNFNYYCSYAHISDEVYRGNIILFNSASDILVNMYTRSREPYGALPLVSRIKVNSHFSYVEEFVDCLISYRIKNGVDTLSDIPIDTIIGDFFMSRLDDIKKHYETNEKIYLGEIKAIDDSVNTKKEKVYAKINAAKTQLAGIISKYGNNSSEE